MTEDVPDDHDTAEDDRAARLAALLSVTIGSERSPEQDDVATAAAPSVGGDHDVVAVAAPASPLARSHPRVGRFAWATLGLLLVAGVGLAYSGARLIRSSTAGEVLAPIVDPTEPGYEAIVDPSPTLVMVHDVDGDLDSITVLSLASPDGGGGGVLLVPTRAIADLPMLGDVPVETVYDPTRPMVQADATGVLLGAGMREVAVVSDDRWADLVAPVAPITLENPNELRDGDEVTFAAGEIELDPDDVGPYLRASVEGESDLARLFRQQTFWRAWLSAVEAEGGDAAVPGELDSGVGRFVRALASQGSEVETLPVEPATSDEFGAEPTFVPRADQMRSLVDRFIPLPVSPAPGVRARVRVLNGTPDTSEAASVAGMLPPAGTEVAIVGNAASLDVRTTTIEYAGEEFRDEAEEIAEILGVGAVAPDTRPSDAADITVTLGADHD